jgi:transglutaminase-like putative cysteine protease
MKLQVHHRTHYAYGAPVRDSFNEARLEPIDCAEQTHVHTTMEEALRLRQGVCQDFAHVMIGP